MVVNHYCCSEQVFFDLAKICINRDSSLFLLFVLMCKEESGQFVIVPFLGAALVCSCCNFENKEIK